MGSLTLPIDTYAVAVTHDNIGLSAVLNVSTPAMSHGVLNRAAVVFRSSVEKLSGMAHNVGGLNLSGVVAVVELPFADFDRVHALLREESPVSLQLSYQDVTSTNKPLTGATFFTGLEPVGEGPVDQSKG